MRQLAFAGLKLDARWENGSRVPGRNWSSRLLEEKLRASVRSEYSYGPVIRLLWKSLAAIAEVFPADHPDEDETLHAYTSAVCQAATHAKDWEGFFVAIENRVHGHGQDCLGRGALGPAEPKSDDNEEMDRAESSDEEWEDTNVVYSLESFDGSQGKTTEVEVCSVCDEWVIDGLEPYGLAVHAAVIKQDELTLRRLLERGTSVDACSVCFLPPLAVATVCNEKRMAAVLLEYGATIDKIDGQPHSFVPLLAALARAHDRLAQMMLERGCMRRSINDESYLATAVKSCSDITVKMLLERGAQPNVSMSDGVAMPLHLAACRRSVEIMKVLIQHGADVNLTVRPGLSLLNMVVVIGFDDGLRVLLAADADLAKKTMPFRPPMWDSARHMTALNVAIVVRAEQCALTLLEHGADPNSVDNTGGYPLQYALRRNLKNIIEALLEHGASLSRLPGAFHTPLEASLRTGDPALVELLLQKGAVVDDDESLKWAVKHRKVGLVWILAAQAPPRHALRYIGLALERGNQAIVDILRERTIEAEHDDI